MRVLLYKKTGEYVGEIKPLTGRNTKAYRAATGWWTIHYKPVGHWCDFDVKWTRRRWIVAKSGMEVTCHWTHWGAARELRKSVERDLAILMKPNIEKQISYDMLVNLP